MRTWIAAGVAIVLVVIAIYVLASAILGDRFITGTVSRVVGDLVRVSGASPWLVKGLVILVTIPFFWAVAKYTRRFWGYKALRPSLDLYVNPYGLVIVVYVAAYFLAMYAVSRGSFFDTAGNRLKWCAETPEGIRVFDVQGVDPVYGIPLKPCTDDQIRSLRQVTAGIPQPQRLTIGDPRHFAFFDGVSGRPSVWYYRGPGSAYEFYDRAGQHPGTGTALKPVDASLVQDLIRQFDLAQQHASEQRAEEASLARARQQQAFVDRYVNRVRDKPKGQPTATVVVDGAPLPPGLREALVQSLRDHGVEAAESVFTPAFAADGRAALIARGDWSAVAGLSVESRVDYVLIVKAASSVRSQGQLEGVLSASLSLSMSCADVVRSRSCGSAGATSAGAGFNEPDAIQNAVEKILPSLSSAVATLRF